MRRLIRAVAGRKKHIVGNLMSWLNFAISFSSWCLCHVTFTKLKQYYLTILFFFKKPLFCQYFTSIAAILIRYYSTRSHMTIYFPNKEITRTQDKISPYNQQSFVGYICGIWRSRKIWNIVLVQRDYVGFTSIYDSILFSDIQRP